MDSKELKLVVQEIVSDAKALKDKHTVETDTPVNYACVFAQSDAEYQELNSAAQAMGTVIQEMKSGQLYHIEDLPTIAGTLRILKIRIPDSTRPERGDADFTVAHYPSFKTQYLTKPHFKLIERTTMEMIELMDPAFNVRAYFSHPPLDQQLQLE